jgi:hypothetical protein
LEYPKYKERVVRIASQFFTTSEEFAPSEVERILRTRLREEVFGEPTMAADHLRVALVELQLLSRSDDGSTYRFNREVFMSPENIRGALGPHYPVERIKSLDHLLKKLSQVGEELKIIAASN